MGAAINDYLRGIAQVEKGGAATEHSYRTAQENLLNALAQEAGAQVRIVHEPARTQHGAPDFAVYNNVGAAIGYVECKKHGEDLRKLAGGAQVKKYRNLSSNILLCTPRHFLLLHKETKTGEAILAERASAKEKDAAAEIVARFLKAAPEKIGDAQTLAKNLAERCRWLRNGLEKTLDSEAAKNSKPRALFDAFRKEVFQELTEKQFADAFAQTLVYGALLAKISAADGEKLTLENVRARVPPSFSLIGELLDFMYDLQRDPAYKELRPIAEDILAVINAMDAAAVSESFSFKKKGGAGDDPWIYFYEYFLAVYDPALREARGVYYTPPEVVRFIIGAAESVLKRDFKLQGGFADSQVTALDFAAGTGTFMLEMMRRVFDGQSAAMRKKLLQEHILKNFYGFEFLIAPYAIAHMKLARFAQEHARALKDDERLRVFITNTLEPPPGKGEAQQEALTFLPALANDVQKARDIKKEPVLVIAGNPPYSGHSQNSGKWIRGLIDDYKKVDGAPLGEKNPKWLQDDYVKFIRFAQWKMESVERGIVAVITNHGFLDNPTFRGMRKSLMDSFNQIYVLDLHGNSKKKETAPNGGKDVNVFDIQQGVCISVFVKEPNLPRKVFHGDLFGLRQSKYKTLAETGIEKFSWRKVNPSTPHYLFTPIKAQGKKYDKFHSVCDIFSVYNAGIVTARDKLTIAFTEKEISKKIIRFNSLQPEEARNEFDLGKDAQDWKIELAQEDLRNSNLQKQNFRPITYRPFDNRFTYYTGKSRGIHCRPRDEVMRHMLAGENIGVITSRRQSHPNCWNNAFASNLISEGHFRVDINYLFPLYCYGAEVGEEKLQKRENFDSKFREWLDARYGKKFSPEEVMAFIYAQLHSPDYRKRYADFLRLDFPRIPFPKAADEFSRKAAIGQKLLDAHLLKNGGDLKQFQGDGTPLVGKVVYDEKGQRVNFAKSAYFSKIPKDVWEFQIGGYKPLDKFLKSRKGRELTHSEIGTFTAAASAIAETIKLMKTIDQ